MTPEGASETRCRHVGAGTGEQTPSSEAPAATAATRDKSRDGVVDAVEVRRGPRLVWPAAALIAAAGFMVTFVAFRPGIMTPDSFSMWDMGVVWRFHDHHHPLIGVMLGVSRVLTGDPAAYLALQLGLWWGGAYLFAVAWRAQVGRWALLAVAVGFTPPALSLMGYIHKTPLLTSCFLFAMSWLLVLGVSRRRPGIVSAIVLLPVLFVGAVVRGYSLPAAVPILFYGAWLVCRGGQRHGACVRLGVTSALLVVAGFAVLDRVLTYEVLDARHSFKIQTVFRFDLAAIHALTGRTYAEDFLVDRYRDREAALAFYQRERGLWRISGMYRRVGDTEGLRALRRQWLRAIVENPRAYLAHRANAIARSLGLRERVIGYRHFATDRPENTAGLRQPESAIRDLVTRQQVWARDLLFMRPWFWALADVLLSLVAGLVLLRVGRAREAVLPHAIMLWSGLLLLVPYLSVCLDRDARFTYWTTVSAIFGGLGLVGALSRTLGRRPVVDPEGR